MIQHFIEFVSDLFPSISPYTKEKVKESLKQFELKGVQLKYSMHNSLPHLAQGDVFEELPFYKQDQFGNLNIFKTKAILLSNTCDAERDDVLLFAPLIKISDIDMDIAALKSNQIYRLLHFPDPSLSEYVVDFSIINSFSRQLIETKLTNSGINKVLSLNDFGYYLFLAKMTIYLMRPEDFNVQKDRVTLFD